MHPMSGDNKHHGHAGMLGKITSKIQSDQQGLRDSEFDRAPRSQSMNGSSSNDGREHTGNPLLDRTMEDGTSMKNAYLNPAFYREQPKLWLPRDQLGLSAEQVQKAREHGVDITDEDATIDQKAKLELQRDTLPGQDFDP